LVGNRQRELYRISLAITIVRWLRTKLRFQIIEVLAFGAAGFFFFLQQPSSRSKSLLL